MACSQHQPPVAALSPCVAVHTEETQLSRFTDRLLGLQLSGCADPPATPLQVTIVACSSPLVYARVQEQQVVGSKGAATDPGTHGCCSPRALERNELLRRHVETAFGSGRIRAHRVYQLDWSCTDPEWIPMAAPMLALKHNGSSFRVVAFPKQLQPKITVLLQSHGYAAHPTAFSHELYVTMQSAVSPYFHFGVAPRSSALCSLNANGNANGVDDSAGTSADTTQSSARAAVAADAPCRAYFKMEESLRHVALRAGDRVLDVGASPGGWTECLLAYGAHVVAVDPGALTIDVTNKPVVHLQMLLEDAMQQLAHMAPFAMCVCDINVRVQHMAVLMASVAPLLRPGAHVVFTLKLGKKPTALAVQQSIDAAVALLAPSFEDFRALWLHANTQNERTLVAVRRRGGTLIV